MDRNLWFVRTATKSHELSLIKNLTDKRAGQIRVWSAILFLPMLLGCTSAPTRTPFSAEALADELEGSALVHNSSTWQSWRGFAYEIGTIGGNDEIDWPVDVTASATSGEVQVRIYSTSMEPSTSEQYASAISNSLARVGQEIWRAGPSHIEYDLALTDQAGYVRHRGRLGRGRPWEIRLLARPQNIERNDGVYDHLHVAAHELYHLMIQYAERGSRDPRARERQIAASIYEEAAAFLYGHCAALLGDGITSVNSTPSFSISRPDSVDGEMRAPFNDDELIVILDALEGHSPPPFVIHIGIGLTLWAELADGIRTVQRTSPQGASFLGMCREIAVDPFLIEPILREIAHDGVETTQFVSAFMGDD